jgi:hypothetical protein
LKSCMGIRTSFHEVEMEYERYGRVLSGARETRSAADPW